MPSDYRALTAFLVDLGIERVPHTQRNYLAYLVAVYQLMKSSGESEVLCQAGMFHSIYGTEKFQGFKLDASDRPKVEALVGRRAERLAYWNCFMDRASLDEQLERPSDPLRIRHRESGAEVPLEPEEFDDLCRVHLYDWLEQAPRSRFGWDYRRAAYRRMAERLGGAALVAYEEVYAAEPKR